MNTLRRSRMEIYIDILVQINSGASKPTRIMYASNISYNVLKKCLESLVNQELVEERDNQREDRMRVDTRTKKKYYITEKGLGVVRYFQKADSLIKITPAM